MQVTLAKPKGRTIKERILDCVFLLPGQTPQQIADYLEINPNTCRPTLSELIKEGYLSRKGTLYFPISDEDPWTGPVILPKPKPKPKPKPFFQRNRGLMAYLFSLVIFQQIAYNLGLYGTPW